jgi:hypothetical protein
MKRPAIVTSGCGLDHNKRQVDSDAGDITYDMLTKLYFHNNARHPVSFPQATTT